MGIIFDKPLASLYDGAPMRRTAERIAKGMSDRLHGSAVRRTPVASPPPGVGATSFMASRGRRPGTLRERWEQGAVHEGRSPTGTVRFSADEINDDPVFDHVEYATRPHVIRPRLDRRPASVLATGKPRRAGSDPQAHLAWIGPGGRVVFALEVHHPGTQGAHMTRDALAEVEATWADEIGVPELERWAAEVGS